MILLLQLVQVVAEVGQGLLQPLPLLGVLANLVGLGVAVLVHRVTGHDLKLKQI